MRRCELFAKELPTQRHRGTEKEMRKVWKQTTSHVIFSLFLCVSAPLCLTPSQLLRLGSHPNELRTQSGRQAKALPDRPHLFAGRRPRESGSVSWFVTDMVKPRTLTSDFVTHFPCGFWDFAESQYCKQMGYWRQCPFPDVFWPTKSYQILPIFTKNVHRTGSNRQIRVG